MRLVVRALAAIITAMPWPTLRRCDHSWTGRVSPIACQRCGAPKP